MEEELEREILKGKVGLPQGKYWDAQNDVVASEQEWIYEGGYFYVFLVVILYSNKMAETIFTTAIISMLGVAYPILLQVIARLDEKYESDHVLELFDQELSGILFRWSLYTSLFFMIVRALNLQPLFDYDFLYNSAEPILMVSCTILVICFFYFVRTILTYYTPTKVIKYLITKYKSKKDSFTYFEALTDILLLSIRKQNNNLAISLSDFFYDAFKREREMSKDKPVIYPVNYYLLVNKAIEELAILREKRNYSLEYRTAGGTWLLGELQGSSISEPTYSWLWRNILLAIQYESDSMIVYHWESSSQYFDYNLPFINEIYENDGENVIMKNKDAVEKRILERNTFIEFHYALGGLLLYKGKYESIVKLFSFTQSIPPKYSLLPESMTVIFKYFNKINDPYDNSFPWISHKYPFPDLRGLLADEVIKSWISKYMALLFLRQYSIVPYLSIMKPMAFPHFPRLLNDLKEWIEQIHILKSLVAECLGNQTLLKLSRLDFINHEWCDRNAVLFPTAYLDDLKEHLEAAYQRNAINQVISQEKVDQFRGTTVQIIESTLDAALEICSPDFLNSQVDKWYVKGTRTIDRKDSFSEHPEAHYFNFDSYLADGWSKRFNSDFSNTFVVKRTSHYLLKAEDLFKAVDQLEINSECIIIGFSFNFHYYIHALKEKGLSMGKYKGVAIYNFPGNSHLYNTLFVIRKSDLPTINTMDIDNEVISKYSLIKSSERYFIYTSVLDLNIVDETIIQEISREGRSSSIQKSVLCCILLNVEIKWKKDVEVIQLSEHSAYRQLGIVNTLNEIRTMQNQILPVTTPVHQQ